MKKLLLFLSLTLSPFVVLADEKDVAVLEVTNPHSVPRSIVQKPSISINDQTYELSVSYLTNENCTLYVYDQCGNILFQEMLISDGVRHSYQLPMLESGEHTVSIEGEKRSFEGTFNI